MECPYCGGMLAACDANDADVVFDGFKVEPDEDLEFEPPYRIFCQSCGQVWKESNQ
mgnify:CR=1 FL=1